MTSDVGTSTALPKELGLKRTRKLNSKTIDRTGRKNGIDAVRGAAVIAMILFHFSWDWNYEVYPLRFLGYGYWEYVPDAIGATFFFVAGMSQYLSPKDPLREGIKIFGWGLVLTAASLIYSPNGPIAFGVLHSLGVSKILSRPFTRSPAPHSRPPAFTLQSGIWGRLLLSLLALSAIVAGFWLRSIEFASRWSYVFIWIGFRPKPIPTMADYYPLLPDIGYMWLGIVAGASLFSSSLRSSVSKRRWQTLGLGWTGRHALVIYLTHQPLLFGLVSFIRYFRLFKASP